MSDPHLHNPRGRVHALFEETHGHRTGRLEYGLDFVKAMPDDWTDEQRLAQMVRLYDDLVAHHQIDHPDCPSL